MHGLEEYALPVGLLHLLGGQVRRTIEPYVPDGQGEQLLRAVSIGVESGRVGVQNTPVLAADLHDDVPAAAQGHLRAPEGVFRLFSVRYVTGGGVDEISLWE